MRKLYETKPILFAVLWIVLYCAVMAPIRGRFGDDSVQMLLGLTAISTGLLLFIRANTLQGELGLDRWIRNGKKNGSPRQAEALPSESRTGPVFPDCA